MDVRIRHILSNGTEVDDITGKVIKAEQHPVLYEVISKIAEKEEGDNNVMCKTV